MVARRRGQRVTVVISTALVAVTVLGSAAGSRASATIAVTRVSSSSTIAPAVTGLAPHDGPVAGGTTITVTGRGFTSASRVTVGARTARDVRVLSATKLTAVAPAHGAASQYLRVRTPVGTSASGPASRYAYVPTPRPLALDGPSALTQSAPRAVSCVLASFCAVLSADGYGTIYRDGTWRTPVPIMTIPTGPQDLSCASTDFCVAVSAAGQAVTYRADRWSQPVQAVRHQSVAAISCVRATFCMAVTERGLAVRFDGTRWHEQRIVPPRDDLLVDVSCASVSFCYAVSSSGYVVRYQAGRWDEPRRIDNRGLAAVSCASLTFCATLTTNGIRIFAGTTWSTVIAAGVIRGGFQNGFIACASTRFCVAGDGAQQGSYGVADGAAVTRQTFATGSAVQLNPTPTAAACWASRRCVFLTQSNDGTTYGWRTPN